MKNFSTTAFTLLISLITGGVSISQITMVRDLYETISYSGSPNTYTKFNNYLYFNGIEAGNNGNGIGRIFKTDGTAAGTTVVPNSIGFDLYFSRRAVAAGHLYYGIGGELRRINGITGVDEVVKANVLSIPSAMVEANGLLIFTNNGTNIWRSDGTPEGTYEIFSISGYIAELVSVGPLAYFAVGNQLYKTDGTTTGTELAFQQTFGINSLFEWNGGIYFQSGIGSGGPAISKFENGVVTRMTNESDIYANSRQIFKTPNALYFFGHSLPPENVDYLMKTDGTALGTTLVKTLNGDAAGYFTANAGRSVSPAYGNQFFFPAGERVDGTNVNVELWVSDGTEVGTYRLKDINPGQGSSNPKGISVINGICYFVANDGTSGIELWKSDGTAEGTQIVMDLYPGANNGVDPYRLDQAYQNTDYNSIVYNDRYFFTGKRLDSDVELYATGGSEPVPISMFFSQNLGWCVFCDKMVLKNQVVDGKNEYIKWISGDAATPTSSRFDIFWDTEKWKAQYFEKSASTGGILLGNSVFAVNGLSTSPKPPCSGWSSELTVLGDCVTASVNVSVPDGGPNMNISAVKTTGVLNDKNIFEIPVIGGSGTDKVTVSWNGAMSRWEMVLETPGARIVGTTVLATNSLDLGSNPPCNGWNGGYGLSGDICLTGTLPVKLFSFHAEVGQNQTVKLSWKTAQEQSSNYFGIERSKDMNTFEEIAKVQSEGNTKELANYKHTDEAPFSGRSYYRLRQVDKDGKETLSRAVTVRISGTDSPYPNPAQGGMVEIEAIENAVIRLTDQMGREIEFNSKRVDENSIEITPRRRLQSGVYIIWNNGMGHKLIVD